MDVYRVTDHVVGGDALAFVFRMRLTGVGQVVGSINFLSGHRGIGRIDHDEASIDLLQQVTQTFFVGVEPDVVLAYAARYLLLSGEIDGLGDVLK